MVNPFLNRCVPLLVAPTPRPLLLDLRDGAFRVVAKLDHLGYSIRVDRQTSLAPVAHLLTISLIDGSARQLTQTVGVQSARIVRPKGRRVEHASFRLVHGRGQVIPPLGTPHGDRATLLAPRAKESIVELRDLITLFHYDRIARKLYDFIRGQLEIDRNDLVLLAQKVRLHTGKETQGVKEELEK